MSVRQRHRLSKPPYSDSATPPPTTRRRTRRFATGEVGFGDDVTYPRIFSLAQCTPDMTATECRSCLGEIITRMIPQYFVGRLGGRVFGVRCNFRFETYCGDYGYPIPTWHGYPTSYRG
uniref:Gnk2-homologous domain-containing protein n=1 Tax=Oryza nivara TaxID=4536 RepID=A0A0E0IXK0_ORYNI